jgi:molybdopterin-guanine dinucleotide biosynthesis protein A
MGTDKARLRLLGGQQMAVHIAGVVSSVCDRVALIRRDRDDWGDLEVLADPPEAGDDRHPLWGVVAACRAARTPVVVLVTCDVPAITGEALQALIDAAEPDGAVAFDGDRTHPLVAALPAGWADRALSWARDGRSVHTFVEGCRRVTLTEGVLLNVNRPEDAPDG